MPVIRYPALYPDDLAFLIYTGFLAGRLDLGGPGQISADESVALEAVKAELQEVFNTLGIKDFHDTSFGFWRVILDKFGNCKLGAMSYADREQIKKWQEFNGHKCADTPTPDEFNNENCCCCGFNIYVADGPCPLIGDIECGYLCLVCNEARKK